MLAEWIEPAKEKRLWEIVKICEEENNEFYDQFNETLCRLKKYVPLHVVDDLNRLEDIFLQKNSSLRKAYNLGFDDGLMLTKEIKELI